MSSLFACPQCNSLTLLREQMVDHVAFRCRHCQSEFATEIDAAQLEPATRRRQKSSATATILGASASRGLRPVLVVEDHDDTRRMVETFLEMDGFAVCTAEHGLAAFDCLVENRPCLILLDISMPIMDGITFGRALRRHPDRQLAATPIVLLSALSDVAEAMQATGAVACLAKPIDFDQVVQAVLEHCTPRLDE